MLKVNYFTPRCSVFVNFEQLNVGWQANYITTIPPEINRYQLIKIN